MYLVGLTGGIAAGKTVVSDLWQNLGAHVIDADQLARRVVEPGTEGLNQLVQLFGSQLLNADGSLNRSVLANIIFNSEVDRRNVEKILHPKIKALAIHEIETAPVGSIVVYVIPLLVESKSDLPFDFVVTVEAPPSEQLSRMVSHRKMNIAEAKARVSAQATPAERANLADRVLSSNQSLELLKKDATNLWNDILKLAEAKDAE